MPSCSILLTIPVAPTALDRLQRLPGVTVQQAAVTDVQQELPRDLLTGQQVLLCKQPPRNFEDLQALQVLQLSTVGYEHLAHLKLGARALQVCNARGIFDTAIAEWNLAMMINLTRDLRGMIRNQEQSHWERTDRQQQEIRGKVVGLWGYGGIGRETARLAKAFGLTVHVLSRRGVQTRSLTWAQPGTGDPDGLLPDRVYTQGQELEFLGTLDYLVLALPRTRETTGRLGVPELRALPPRAFVLNPARGPIIQEQALLQALRAGWIAGAALDTHYAYPLPPEHPLWSFPNVILTPHISGADKSERFLDRVSDLFVTNVERFLAGEPLLNQVTKQDLQEV